MKVFMLAVAGIVVAGLAGAPLGLSQGQEIKDGIQYANERALLQGHLGGVEAISFSPDGKLLAVACKGPNECVKIWDVAKVECIKTLDDFPDAVQISSVCFSPDGKSLATAGYASAAYIYDVATWEKRHKLDVGEKGTGIAVFSPDGKTLVVTTTEQQVTTWDAENGQKPGVLKTGMKFNRALAYSSDGNNIAIGGYGEGVIWEVAKEKVHWKLEGHEKGVDSLAFSPDSKFLVTVEYKIIGNTVLLWDVETGKRTVSLDIGNRFRKIGAAVFSPDGKTLAIVGDMKITLWQPGSGEFTRQMLVEPRGAWDFTCVAFSPDSQCIAAGTAAGTVSIVNVTKT